MMKLLWIDYRSLIRMRIGVDLGGTKTEALAMGDQGAELERIRVSTIPGD